ncbi:serine/threonine-protein phosphatase [Paenarthrobacter sp. DKR-5]|uniref:PP2C family protein-serine/threonine phosphatase n=1 Tax=Paenarthrobacter sp. DKR-5 TaxID=2835535 RepID=UPI001BDBC204|nr:protein phosphatase 2C domain-containing protein [Paenarthrobacter sp. DKR-5]MBT1002533.1 serine/threonine-protein phosphatase [Paenarthrobacter sp. DKR-5]
MKQQAATPGRIELRFGTATDRGLRRLINEDSLLARNPLFAVADGMGGHEAGEVASRLCVEALAASALLTGHTRAEDVALALAAGDASIREATGSRAGTTVTGVVLVEESGNPYWLFFNVGDSRCYRLRGGGLEQITVDHSEVQELVDLGRITPAQALVHPRRHVVTRALGTGSDAEADFWLNPVEDGDRILICSDGLTSEVPDEEIARILAEVHDAGRACEELVQAALRSGGRDNITVIVVDAAGPGVHRSSEVTAPAEDDEADSDTLPRGLRSPQQGSNGTAGGRTWSL